MMVERKPVNHWIIWGTYSSDKPTSMWIDACEINIKVTQGCTQTAGPGVQGLQVSSVANKPNNHCCWE